MSTLTEPKSSTIKLLIVDEKTLYRKSLYNLIRTEQPNWDVFEANDASKAADLVTPLNVNIILINSAGTNRAFELIKSFRRDFQTLRIVLLIQYTEPALISNAIKAGANAIVPITSDPQELISALRLALYEGNYFNGAIKDAYDYSVINNLNVKLELSTNESKILELLGRGNNTKQISEQIGLTPFTVDSYRKKLLQKTKSRNVAHLISLMHKTGIL